MLRGIRERIAHNKQHHHEPPPSPPRVSPGSHRLRVLLHLDQRGALNVECPEEAGVRQPCEEKTECVQSNDENEANVDDDDDDDEGSRSRSVNDFSTADELKQALLSCHYQGSSCRDSASDETAWLFSKNDRVLQTLLQQTTPATDNSGSDGLGKIGDQKMDWVLEDFDTATSDQQTLDHELRRLLVLKSFLILDTNRKESFDGITARAQKAFGVPMCMISLVDLGRQWFLSKQGLDAPETPRNISFCTHAIQSKLDVFEVTDATQDERFKENPLVTGPPYVKYYVGAPLVSPEGYKIGTLCLVDRKPHDPLTVEQRESLKSMADKAVQTLVRHRRKMTMWFNNLVSTHFPDVYDSDESDDEHRTVQDEHDSAFDAFLEATNNLSMESLVELLQKRAKEQHSYPLKPALVSDSTASKKHLAGPTRHVRFDENADVVYTIENWRGLDLWMTADDFEEIRAEKRELVRYFRKNRPDYKRALNRLVQQQEKDDFRELLDSNARGLESQIIDLLRERRKSTRKAVVRAQWCYHDELAGDGRDYAMERIRITSLQQSGVVSTFAANLAQVDHIDALFSVTNPMPISPAA
mmetsp:Transcript_17777/g.33751  ORF Transcript_17777/g.33751 Transcript_17777/m.33751 type:complete len:584 (-) Transcript_17777:88-1839(-)